MKALKIVGIVLAVLIGIVALGLLVMAVYSVCAGTSFVDTWNTFFGVIKDSGVVEDVVEETVALIKL